MTVDSRGRFASDSKTTRTRIFKAFSVVLVLALPTMAGLITYTNLVRDNVAGVDGLRGVASIAISADGLNLYAVGQLEDALAVFSRDLSDGSLQFLEVHRDGSGGVLGMRFPSAVAVSRDGRHVYAVAEVDDSLVVFQREPSTGRLTFADAYQDEVEGIFGLNGANAVTVTPDDQYVVVSGYTEDTLTVFSRQATSDYLAFVDIEQDGEGETEMLGPSSVTVSPDGSFLYVAASLDNSVSVFTRDPTADGFLYVGKEPTGYEPRGLAIDKQGNNAYITGQDWVSVARRDKNSGALSPVWLFEDNLHGADGLEGARAVVVLANGSKVAVGGENESAVAVFSRDISDGFLELEKIYRDGVDGVEGISYPTAFAVSPDQKFLYVAGSGDDAIAIFELPDTSMVFSDGFENGSLAGWSSTSQ